MKRASLIVLLLLIVPSLVTAQVPGLTVPDASPSATVSQVVGLTEMSVSYHRPAVNGRRIWGGIVPLDQVWRAGANENTTVSFSTPVTVNGTRLAAGTYGLHLIPTNDDWTVIFSNQSRAWGSFTYDEKEDAARVIVRPEDASSQERLGYSFDEPTADSVVLAMRWEKIRVPLEVRIDLGTVIDDFETQLRGLPRFGWQGWNQAANWAVQNDLDPDKALQWADNSISRTRNFMNLRTKARILERKGQAGEAAKLNAEAMEIATEAEINAYGYQLLLGQQKVDEAIEIFRKNVKDHPESWNVYDSLAEAYGVKGDKTKAIEYYTKALNMTTDPVQKTRIEGAIKALRAK